MAPRTSEATVSQQKQNVGNTDADHASVVMSGIAITPGRRRKARMDYRCLCSYEVLEAIDEESAVIEQRKAFVLNRSTEGILLFMALAPQPKQLIEVHTLRSGWDRTANVFEVR